jgi:hypothetical protein
MNLACALNDGRYNGNGFHGKEGTKWGWGVGRF